MVKISRAGLPSISVAVVGAIFMNIDALIQQISYNESKKRKKNIASK
jgi:hypothetical protein